MRFPFLVVTLHEENSGPKNILVLRFGANALKRIAERLKRGFPEAVPELMGILENRARAEANGATDDELQDSDAAADCLAYFGKDAKQAVPLLIELLPNERNRKPSGHYQKLTAITSIIDQLRVYKDFSANNAITAAFESTKAKLDENDRTAIANTISLLKTAKALSDWQWLINPSEIFVKYPTLTSLIVVGLFGGLVWFALFLFRPLWLLRIYESLPTGDAHISGILGTVSFPIRYLWGACTLRPRVLDAWVKTKLDDADRNFSKKKPVRERRIYVPLPGSLDGRLVTQLVPKDLRETFERSQSRILISGPGGCGKTSLAFQIAYWAMRKEGEQRPCPSHAMLPILLEGDFSARGEDALREEIAAQLSDLLNPTEKMSQSFLTSLLSYKRIIVLVDGMSEFNEEIRSSVLSGLARSLVKAVVFTSRTDETIGNLNRTSITPTNIKKINYWTSSEHIYTN